MFPPVDSIVSTRYLPLIPRLPIAKLARPRHSPGGGRDQMMCYLQKQWGIKMAAVGLKSCVPCCRLADSAVNNSMRLYAWYVALRGLSSSIGRVASIDLS